MNPSFINYNVVEVFRNLTQVSSPFTRSFCTDLMPNKDVSLSRRVRLPVETNIAVCVVLAASLQCIV